MKKILIITLVVFCFTSKATLKLPPDTFLYANLQVTKLLLDVKDRGHYYNWITSASFFDNITHSTVAIGNVKYGNVFFKSDIHYNNSYFDTVGIQFPDSTRLWQVTGSGNIPNFSYMPTNPMPNFTGYNLVTGTVTINLGVSIPYSGITNATNVTIVISDGVNEVIESFAVNTTNTLSRLTNGAVINSNSVFIPASDLAILSPTNNAFINIIVSNVDYEVFSGKRIAFSRTFMYKKDKVVIE